MKNKAQAKQAVARATARRQNPAPRAAKQSADATTGAKQHQERRSATRKQEARVVEGAARRKTQAVAAVVTKVKKKAKAVLDERRQRRYKPKPAMESRGDILRRAGDDRVDLRPKPGVQSAPAKVNEEKNA